MRIQLQADDVKLDVSRDAAGKLATTVGAAQNGMVLIELTRLELQGLLIAFADAALEEHGVKIQSAELSLSSAGDRGLVGSLRVSAKKMLVSVDLVISARADVDERLRVRVSGLGAEGEGLINSVAAGMLRTKLEEHEFRMFDLAPEALRSVKLTGLKVEAHDPVRISASFHA